MKNAFLNHQCQPADTTTDDSYLRRTTSDDYDSLAAPAQLLGPVLTGPWASSSRVVTEQVRGDIVAEQDAEDDEAVADAVGMLSYDAEAGSYASSSSVPQVLRVHEPKAAGVEAFWLEAGPV